MTSGDRSCSCQWKCSTGHNSPGKNPLLKRSTFMATFHEVHVCCYLVALHKCWQLNLQGTANVTVPRPCEASGFNFGIFNIPLDLDLLWRICIWQNLYMIKLHKEQHPKSEHGLVTMPMWQVSALVPQEDFRQTFPWDAQHHHCSSLLPCKSSWYIGHQRNSLPNSSNPHKICIMFK